MTALLKTAIERIQNLPQEDQDFYARQLLRGLEVQTTISSGQTTEAQLDAFMEAVMLRAKQEPDTSEGSLDELRVLMDETGRQAQASGWNDELDAKLLRGDFDDD